jgi:hypothetical protein
MPVGDLPGWKQVFTDDFATAVPLGSFPGSAYGSRWTAYDGFTDTLRRGLYSPAQTLSAHDGVLDMYLRAVNGQPLSAAPVPLINGQWGGLRYGKVSVRFRADPVPGYKTAWLLWPDSDNWSEGEIDFPEGDLDGTIQAFNHQPGDPARNAFAKDTGVTYRDWHTASIEWIPGKVTFILDGVVVGTSNVSPTVAMHWVLQTETTGEPVGAGHVYVDWVTIYRQA